MPKQVEILLTGTIQDDIVGHKAIVATLDGADALVEVMTGLGITDAKCVSRMVNRRGETKAPQPKLKEVPPAA